MDANGLTERERDILTMLAKGTDRQTIARKLKITAKTVSVHKYNIKCKLGVGSEFEFLHWCMKNLPQENKEELKA